MADRGRGRRGRQNRGSTIGSARGAVSCKCPACSAEDFDLDQLIDDVAVVAEGLLGIEDPLEAEVLGAAFVAIGAPVAAVFEEALVGHFIPRFEAGAIGGAAAMLTAIGAVGPDRVGRAARAAADRLAERGIATPGWAAELAEPVEVSDCVQVADTQSSASVLGVTFRRAGRSHGVLVSVDHTNCHAADDILLIEGDGLDEALEMIVVSRPRGLQLTKQALDAAAFRWLVERALDARAVHDGYGPDVEVTGPPDADDDGPSYPALAVLLRARMATLPEPDMPAASHDHPSGLEVESLVGRMVELAAGPVGRGPRGRTSVAALPPKRKKAAGPAPVYRIKVSLVDARPPIWRRLELPADLSLARLHRVIQVAFGWSGGHMHVFETPYGSFGVADTELGHRAEGRVTLEQVAPAVRARLRYVYDFGDNWRHDIVVEAVLARDPGMTRPRCTGGRRAAPPDDCGGVWGYAELVKIMADPSDPGHEDMLDRLDLDDSAGFSPDRFDVEAVNRALSAMR